MGDPLTLHLPEPPTLNKMLDLAKERTHKTKGGGWRPRALPTVYDERKTAYETRCMAWTRQVGVFPPAEPWPEWALTRAEFRLWNKRDPLELLAGLKWPVDWLVNAGFVADDSPRELLHLPYPTQCVDRENRGVTIEIAPTDPRPEPEA